MEASIRHGWSLCHPGYTWWDPPTSWASGALQGQAAATPVAPESRAATVPHVSSAVFCEELHLTMGQGLAPAPQNLESSCEGCPSSPCRSSRARVAPAPTPCPYAPFQGPEGLRSLLLPDRVKPTSQRPLGRTVPRLRRPWHAHRGSRGTHRGQLSLVGQVTDTTLGGLL